MRRVAAILIASFALGACAPAAVRAQEGAVGAVHSPRLTVSGMGFVEVPADQVTIQVSVVSEAKTAVEALAQNQERVAAMLGALKGLGLTEEEVTTSHFTISPMFGAATGFRQGPITGYSVQNAVSVRTLKLDLAGKTIQAAVNAGANNVDFVSFGLSGDQGRDEAIARAAQHARRDAQTLAKASGVTLGRVRAVALGGGERPFPMVQMARMEFDASGMGGAAPSLTPGSVRVQATVTMEFDIHE